MGTTYTVKIAGSPPEWRQRAIHGAVGEELERINRQMSTYLNDSELSRFNRAAPGRWFPVSANTAFVTAAALAIAEETAGAFDVTVSPLVDLWGFGSGSSGYRVPDRSEITAAMETVGYDLVETRRHPPSLRKKRPDVQVDLSAIAKGYAVDRMAGLIEGFGFTDYLVEIGGEIKARGGKGKRSWTVGVEMPLADRRLVHKVLELHDTSLATSGDYRNFFERDGRRYNHTIDPRTGTPTSHNLASVTVLSENCMTADAWATAFMVLGYEKAAEIAGERHMAVLFVLRGDSGFTFEPSRQFRLLSKGAL